MAEAMPSEQPPATPARTLLRNVSAHPAVRVASAASIALFLVGLPGSAAASEDSDGSCPVAATAQGVQVMVSASDNLLLQAPSGAAVPAAQTCVDYGIKDSSGFAGNPYPGETVIAAPAIIGGAADLPVPGYPAYASSRSPTSEEEKVEAEGYSLSSQSTETSSKAQARSGLAQEGASAGMTVATAESMVDPDAQTATATAAADTQPLTFSDVLRLGQVRSVATAKVGRDGKLARNSDLSIGHTTVAGQTVEITPDGVKAADQGAPLPDTDGAEEALAEAGIGVRYLESEQTRRGVLSAGIEVRVRQQDQETGAVYTAHYVVGRAFAAAAPPGAGPGDGEMPLTPDVGLGDGDMPGTPGTGEQPVDDAGSGPVPEGESPMPEEAPEPGEEPGVADDDAAPRAAPTDVRSAGLPTDMGAAGLYLVIMFGAVAMFASGTLLRLLGVKTRWTS